MMRRLFYVAVGGVLSGGLYSKRYEISEIGQHHQDNLFSTILNFTSDKKGLMQRLLRNGIYFKSRTLDSKRLSNRISNLNFAHPILLASDFHESDCEMMKPLLEIGYSGISFSTPYCSVDNHDCVKMLDESTISSSKNVGMRYISAQSSSYPQMIPNIDYFIVSETKGISIQDQVASIDKMLEEHELKREEFLIQKRKKGAISATSPWTLPPSALEHYQAWVDYLSKAWTSGISYSSTFISYLDLPDSLWGFLPSSPTNDWWTPIAATAATLAGLTLFAYRIFVWMTPDTDTEEKKTEEASTQADSTEQKPSQVIKVIEKPPRSKPIFVSFLTTQQALESNIQVCFFSSYFVV